MLVCQTSGPPSNTILRLQQSAPEAKVWLGAARRCVSERRRHHEAKGLDMAWRSATTNELVQLLEQHAGNPSSNDDWMPKRNAQKIAILVYFKGY